MTLTCSMVMTSSVPKIELCLTPHPADLIRIYRTVPSNTVSSLIFQDRLLNPGIIPLE